MYIMKGEFIVKLHSEEAANEFCKLLNDVKGFEARRIVDSSFDVYVTTRTRVRFKWRFIMKLLKSCCKWTAWCCDICKREES